MNREHAPLRRLWLVLGILVVLVQAVGFYTPSSGDGTLPLPPHGDKVLHAGSFLLATAFALLARLPWVPVIVFMLGHAIVSELIQGLFMESRSGEAADAVADVLGIGFGAFAARWLARSPPERREPGVTPSE
ncbi:VanZ family protein [Brevibacterium jeotgali]|uniref:VanZ like family protein n=1 Tax=Brevibacterium jeotgali TaxID=1262550 RepID=A0A2H1L1R6_9MICO|nr:VanZ family protein [Brevibacterium jeotgali]TWC01929.1 hypothetical protein FB108_0587 [Brevibacterium jeotgali]SMY10720.1 hypothetical protein BJEO58_00295 [Brevibacterium jeotgali]